LITQKEARKITDEKSKDELERCLSNLSESIKHAAEQGKSIFVIRLPCWKTKEVKKYCENAGFLWTVRDNKEVHLSW